jgi:ABC-type branched-subunit amino acid transport system substrate-binding protein
MFKIGAACLVAAVVASGCSSASRNKSNTAGTGTTAASSSGGGGSARGFNGSTIEVAGLATASLFGGAADGAQARFKRANDTNELPGIKIKFVELADDSGDPASALSAARRLVTQDQVFAIVPDISQFNPGPYLTAQKMPFIGWGIDNAYCSATPSTSIWGFGYSGCLTSTVAPRATDSLSPLYDYVKSKTGNSKPTIAILSGDTASGKSAAKYNAASAEGAGFQVVYAKGSVVTTTTDYSPYVAQLMSSAGAKQPMVIDCLLTSQCVQIWQGLKGVGFTGTYFQPLGPTDAVAKTLAGTVTETFWNVQSNKGLTQMLADLNAYKPGTPATAYSTVPGYFAADMFVQGVKKLGKNITPTELQKELSTQTWEIPNFVGPIKYPASTVLSTPACLGLLQDNTDGSGFTPLSPYACSYKTFKLDPRFQG